MLIFIYFLILGFFFISGNAEATTQTSSANVKYEFLVYGALITAVGTVFATIMSNIYQAKNLKRTLETNSQLAVDSANFQSSIASSTESRQQLVYILETLTSLKFWCSNGGHYMLVTGESIKLLRKDYIEKNTSLQCSLARSHMYFPALVEPLDELQIAVHQFRVYTETQMQSKDEGNLAGQEFNRDGAMKKISEIEKQIEVIFTMIAILSKQLEAQRIELK